MAGLTEGLSVKEERGDHAALAVQNSEFGRSVHRWDSVDDMFGWNQAERAKDMQVHYAAMSIRERMATAIITGMM